MFAIKKLILTAACVALALGPVAVAAEPQNMHLRIHISGHSMRVNEDAGASTHMKIANEASSTDSSGDDDAEGSSDSEDSEDATSSKDDSGDSDDSGAFCNGKDEYTMSVEHVEGVFCVKGPSCSADNADGVCPGPQDGLPLGSQCGKVSTGVYGCVQNTPAPTPAPKDSDATTETPAPSTGGFCSGEGEYTMSIEYVPGIFCVKGPACAGDSKDGVCPGPQEGLPFGSFCGKVSSGVSGCKPYTEAPSTEAPGGDDGDASGKDDGLDSADFCAGEDESEMSVEGAEGIYCVKGQACVSTIADGACPGPQKGLPFGSYCGAVKTGVYGCKVNNEAISKHHKKVAADAKKKKTDNAKKVHNAKPVHQSKKVHKESKKVAATHAKKPAVHAEKVKAHQKKPATHAKKAEAHQKKKAEVDASKTHHGKKKNN